MCPQKHTHIHTEGAMDPELVAGDPTTSAPAATVTASPLPDQGGNRKGGHQRFVTATSPSSSQRYIDMLLLSFLPKTIRNNNVFALSLISL